MQRRNSNNTGRRTGRATVNIASEHDCIIVGGGISGLTAAYDLKKKGYNVLVLEAQERVGGRTHTIVVDNKNLDLGGQWVAPQQRNVLKLLDELNIETYKQNVQGKSLLFTGTHESQLQSHLYDGIIPNISWITLVDLQLAIWDVESKAKSIPVDRPWEHERAKEYDSMTVATYMETKFWTQDAKNQFRSCVELVFAADPAEVSFLFLLYTVKICGGIMPLINTEDGAQDSKIRGGAQTISKTLAARLGNDRVKLNSPVAKIDQSFSLDPERVLITTRDGVTYTCKKVIVAMPPTLSARIHYDPPLSGMRDQLCQRMPMAYVIKTTTLFKSFWWRERGYNGFFANSTTCDESFPIKAGFDLTEHPGIVGFILANSGRYWGTKMKKERRDAVLAQFAKVFNVPIELVRSEVIHYEEKNWSEQEFNRGAYMSFATPGALTACGMALRKAIQNIHFAGTETATEWAGYMDGAVQAGLRAASEIESAFSDA